MIEEIQRKIALEQGKTKTEPTAIEVQNTGKPEWEPSDRKRLPRKLRKYWNVETKTVVEEEWYDDEGRYVNML